MTPKPAHGVAAVPSRNALRVLRRLALAGSTVGSFCTVAAITYDVHRRVRIAERIVENKRALQTSAPNYDATSASKRLCRMMEAAEAGEFMSLESWQEEERKFRKSQGFQPEYNVKSDLDKQLSTAATEQEQLVAVSQTRAPTNSEQPTESIHSPANQTIPKYADGKEFPVLTPVTDARSKYTISPPSPTADPTTPSHGQGMSIQEDVSVSGQIQDLLNRNRPIDAAEVFLGAHPASVQGISSGRRELATQTFYINCKQNNVFMARSIFNRLNDIDTVSPTMWKVLLVALARNGSVESVATLYTQFMHKFQLPDDLVDIVLRSLIESRRLTTAKWVLLRNLRVDRDCGLCGAYLQGLWKKTRSIELLNGQFRKLLIMFPRFGKTPTEKLFNPLVKAYVEFGRAADAEALVHEMVNTYEVPLGCRTKGLLVYAKALDCDWEAVEAGFEEMHELNLTDSKRDFTQIFDRIFLEYWVTHTGTEIRDFLYRYIDRFRIVPDRVLYKHILEAFVEKGNTDMIAEFSQLAKERLWTSRLNHDEFLELLRDRRQALEDSPVGFWNMLQVAREEHGRAAATQQVLGYDQRSFPLATVNKMPKSQASLPWYERTLKAMTPSKPVDQYQKLHKQMTHYMHVGKMHEALRCYQNAKNAQFQVKQLHVELAVIATLLEDGLSAARELIETEWKSIRHLIRFFPVFFRQITDADPSAEGELIKSAVLRFYELCWSSKKMMVKHHITAATSRRLIIRKQPELAIDVLTAVYTSRYRRVVKFDAVCMKMFLRAFASVGNLAGVRWCMLTSLSRGSALSRDFVVEVRRLMVALERDSAPGELAEEATERAKQLRYLNHIADILERKCNGESEAWGVKTDLAVKKSYRRMLKRPLDHTRLYNQSEIQRTIEEWDEEYELEGVLGRIDIEPKSILARWNEPYCLGQKTSSMTEWH
ncbi:hypothetical protein ARAM_007223 [Aspergillus rambellii]|uniref:Pentatricopeptide repeat protein n=1 Tax=Aspergillus rambellii TaxID=308745 RepID=A0A0F8XDN9_9EURO|nr:hypothetical protein ARAM_007223 [Aspergillus rambellii]